MEDNKTYFGEIGHGLKTLAVGMKTTWKEYFKDFFTNKSTEQYPENRKTTLIPRTARPHSMWQSVTAGV